jgi:hypothetical protein
MSGNDNSITSRILKPLPVGDLFAAPFDAAIRASAKMATETAAFIRNFGMDNSGNVYMTSMSSYFDIPLSDLPDVSGQYLIDPSSGLLFNTADSDEFPLLYVPFPASSEVYDGVVLTGYKQQIGTRFYYAAVDGKLLFAQGTRSINIPLLGMLNVPSLQIDSIDVDFTINIKTQASVATTNNAFSFSSSSYYANSQGQRNHFDQISSYATGFGMSTTGIVGHHSDTFSNTNTDTTYTVKMRARQIDPPGMAALYQFISANNDTSARKTIKKIGELSTIQDDKKAQA